jgi:hypothetical protein
VAPGTVNPARRKRIPVFRFSAKLPDGASCSANPWDLSAYGRHQRRLHHLGAILPAPVLLLSGHLFTADKLLDVGAAALSSTALVPFKSFLTSNQLADLFARARASFERGAPISPLVDGILTKAIERAAI